MDAFDWTQWLDVPESVDWSATVNPVGHPRESNRLRKPSPDPSRYTARHLLKDAGLQPSGSNCDKMALKDIVRNISISWTHQDKVRLYCELAAKNLPRIAANYQEAQERCPPSATLLSAIISIPESRTLFFEFMSKSGGAALFTSQASRVASLSSVSLQSDPALIAELQEMSYLLYHFLVGTGDLVHNEARKKVIFMLLQASASAPGRGRSDSLDHMVHVLEIEQLFFAQWRAMQAWLSKCRCRGCDTRLSTGYGVQCTRCNYARYCGLQHQAEDIQRHWNECFKPEF